MFPCSCTSGYRMPGSSPSGFICCICEVDWPLLDSSLPLKSGRGGKRQGSGRPSGSGKWGDRKLKRVYIPADFELESYSHAFSQIENIINLFKAQADLAKAQSVTGSYPERHKKVLRMIELLEAELSSLS